MSFPVSGLFPLGSRRLAPPPCDAEVEYLESTGTQFVDTGIAPGQQVEVVLDASYDSSGTKSAIVCGTRSPQTTAGRFYVLGMDASYNAKSTFGSTNYQSANSGVRRVVDLNTAEHKILWDGVVVASIANATTVTSGATIFVFSSNGWQTPTAFAAKARVFSLRIFDTGALVRDFVPVRVGTVGYLYDRANPTGGPLGNGLYGSATSTPLVAGPDKT